MCQIPTITSAGGSSTAHAVYHFEPLFAQNVRSGKDPVIIVSDVQPEFSSSSYHIETIKIFLALSKSGIPVILREAKALGERVAGIEKMGIVPEGVFPRYCHSYFPDEHIIDCIQEEALFILSRKEIDVR